MNKLDSKDVMVVINTIHVHDVPCSFVKALILGRNSALPIHHNAERQCFRKGRDETEALSHILV